MCEPASSITQQPLVNSNQQLSHVRIYKTPSPRSLFPLLHEPESECSRQLKAAMSTPLFSLRLVMLVIQLLVLSLAAVSSARDAPQNLRDFYDAVRAKGRCSK